MTRVLVVEDSRTQALELQIILESAGHDVDIATSGEEGLTRFKARGYDLVFSDIVMPGMTGYQFCRALRVLPEGADVPVVLVTALRNPLDVIHGLACGADTFISKPLEPEFILGRIDYILDNRQHRLDTTTSRGVPLRFLGEQFIVGGSRPSQVVDFLVSAFEDAVRSKQREEQLLILERDRSSQLANLNEQLNNLVGMAAHDLRNPLSVVLAFSDLMLRDLSAGGKEQHIQFVSKIRSTSEFMWRLVNGILDLAKVQSGTVQLDRSETDVVNLLEKNVSLNRFLAERKQIVLDLATMGTFQKMSVDAMKIEQVLNNLISNAIKFSHSGTVIKVKAIGASDQVLISVQDQGQGIPAEELDKIFEPFQKTSVRGTAGEKSTGLGLAITRKIVEDHGGRLMVESKVGQGSTFMFSLPVRKLEPSVPKPITPP